MCQRVQKVKKKDKKGSSSYLHLREPSRLCADVWSVSSRNLVILLLTRGSPSHIPAAHPTASGVLEAGWHMHLHHEDARDRKRSQQNL